MTKKALIATMAFTIIAGMQPTAIAKASDDEFRMDSSTEELTEYTEDSCEFTVGDMVSFNIDNGYVIDGAGTPVHISRGECFYVTAFTGKPNLLVCFVPKSNMDLYIYSDTRGLDVRKGEGAVVGDLTGDLRVDTFDFCELVYRIVNDTTGDYGSLGLHIADYNYDGEVNISDAVRMKSFILKG